MYNSRGRSLQCQGIGGAWHMQKWLQPLLGTVCVAAGILSLPGSSRAETATLQLKQLSAISRGQMYSSQEYVYRQNQAQYFHVRLKSKERNPAIAEFTKLVKKEPAKYLSKEPARFVASLGSQKFAFVLDDQEGKANGYGRLYFDRNGNGDLTDDKAIASVQGHRFGNNYVSCEFPRVDVAIEVEGTKVDYAFRLSVHGRTAGEYAYLSASISSAVYREGEIELDGKRRRVVVLDYNSNGRFNDQMEIREDVRMHDGRVYGQSGDLLLLDPVPAEWSPGNLPNGQYVSKLANIDGRFYELKISAAGDQVTLTPSKLAVGQIINPNDGFRAIVYGKEGFLDIHGGKSKPVALPQGDWKLYCYKIDQTPGENSPEPAAKDKKEAGQQSDTASSLLEGLASALLKASGASPSTLVSRSRPKYTIVSAYGTRSFPAVKVEKGKTVAFPFGPPYKPVVTGHLTKMLVKEEEQKDEKKDAKKKDSPQKVDMLYMSLSLTGCSGEICTDLMVGGGRPGKPKFTVSLPDGKQVGSGNFEYG